MVTVARSDESTRFSGFHSGCISDERLLALYSVQYNGIFRRVLGRCYRSLSAR